MVLSFHYRAFFVNGAYFHGWNFVSLLIIFLIRVWRFEFAGNEI